MTTASKETFAHPVVSIVAGHTVSASGQEQLVTAHGGPRSLFALCSAHNEEIWWDTRLVTSTDSEQGRPDFFVSYTEADRAWAEWIAWTLENVGFRVVIKAWDFGPGSHFVAEMHQAAQQVQRTIAVLSEAYLCSGFGTEEWQATWVTDPAGRKRRLLVVRIEDCQQPGLLRQVVSVDLFGIDERAARERILRLADDVSTMVRMKPLTAPQFPPNMLGAPSAKPFPGSVGKYQHGGRTNPHSDLIIHTKWNVGESIFITYEAGSAGRLECAVEQRHLREIIPAISNELRRMQVRFGADSVATLAHLARDFSRTFFPSEVLHLVQQGRIDRLRIVVGEASLHLPWELAHDGNDFLALNFSILNTRAGQSAQSLPARGRSALTVEGVPDLYGMQQEYFPPDANVSIQRDDTRISRVRVRDRNGLIQALSGTPAYDLLNLGCHSIVGQNGELTLLVGDERLGFKDLISVISRNPPEVVILSACQSAAGGPGFTYDASSAFQMSLALPEGYVLGVIGWLEMVTAERFETIFRESYLDMKDVERAVIQTRRELFREQCEDWWRYSLFGPA